MTENCTNSSSQQNSAFHNTPKTWPYLLFLFPNPHVEACNLLKTHRGDLDIILKSVKFLEKSKSDKRPGKNDVELHANLSICFD